MSLSRGLRRRLSCLVRTDPTLLNDIRTPLIDANIDIVDPHAPHADAIIVDLRPAALDGTPIGTAIKEARQDGYGKIIVFLIASTQSLDAPLSAVIGQDIVVRATAHHLALIRALQAAAELTVAAREVGVRTEVAATLSRPVHTPTPSETNACAVLQCAPSPLALDVMGDLASRTRTNATIRGSQSLHALEMREGDALVILAEGSRKRPAALIRLMRRHSDLFDIPILVLEPAPRRRHISFWTSLGADDVFAVADINHAVAQLEFLRTRRRNRLQIDANLRATTLNSAGAQSRLADNRLFEACLFKRHANGFGSIGALRVTPADGNGHASALAEVSVYLAMTTRLVDLVTRVRDDLFLVSLPDCDSLEARRVMDTMTTLVNDLQFGPHDDSCTFTATACSLSCRDIKDPTELVRAVIRGTTETVQTDLATV